MTNERKMIPYKQMLLDSNSSLFLNNTLHLIDASIKKKI